MQQNAVQQQVHVIDQFLLGNIRIFKDDIIIKADQRGGENHPPE